MTPSIGQLGALLGAVGLFLLGMWLMTEGLRQVAGSALRDILTRSTRTRWHALASGIALTAAIQSSSAVTVAAIGFVNAGLLSLGQVLWVLFGSNVGTTMTGWLVALVGLEVKVELLAMPMIGVGMLLRLFGGNSRRAGVGLSLAGLGLLFLGIAALRQVFDGLAHMIHFAPATGLQGLAFQVLLGASMTLLMQSSSVATALTLTAAQAGLLDLESAAAVVIGANIGTTGTAVLAALGATANARRTAAAHVLFNLLTGLVALLVLPWLLGFTQWLGQGMGWAVGVATVLALFHTLFNLLGVLLMWPMGDRMARFLERRFRTTEEDESRPRYLDATTAEVPALAVEALSREQDRFGDMALQAAGTAALHHSGSSVLASTRRSLAALDAAMDAFVVRLNRDRMSQETAQRLAHVLRRGAYFSSVLEQLPAIASGKLDSPAQFEAIEVGSLRQQAAHLLEQLAPQRASKLSADIERQVATWDTQYRDSKAALLQAGALGQLAPQEMENLLRSNSALRRAVQQSLKATQISSQPVATP